MPGKIDEGKDRTRRDCKLEIRPLVSEIERLEPKFTMSCRVDRHVGGDDVVILCISGGITGQYVDMLRDLLSQERGTVVIDLKNVLLIDRPAVKLLMVSESNGIELRNCPGYVREWIERERAQTRA